MNKNNIKIVISGSFRKHYSEIKKLIVEFEKEGFSILSPVKSEIVNHDEEFILLSSDSVNDPKKIEKKHLDAIYQSDILYIYNPDGYIGPSVSMELGWALSFNKPIYSKEESNDVTLKMFIKDTGPPKEIKKKLLKDNTNILENINRYSTFEQIQKYIECIVKDRGFDRESPRDILLLMIEEIGELAKAIRKDIGLKTDKDKISKYPKINDELADILIYLLDLSNNCNVDLFNAFYNKELKNQQREWK